MSGKRNMRYKKLLSYILILSMVLGVMPVNSIRAHAETSTITYSYGDYEYILNEDDEATITKYNGSDENLIIPDELNGNIVVAINDYVFENKTFIKSIKLPNNLRQMGYHSFYNIKITEVTLPKTLESADRVFVGCTKLTDVYFEEGITKIPGSVFAEVPAVKNIHWVDSIIEIGDYAFKQVGIEKLELPDQITTIGVCAFAECENLTELKLSSNLKKAEYHSFYGIPITEVTIPKTLESADRVFVGCTKLTDVYFEEGITKIPESVFAEVPAVKNIHWVDSIIEIENYAFKQVGIEKLELPDQITTIGDFAFAECESLTELKLSSNLKQMGYHSFYNIKITEVTLPKTLESADRVFVGCTKLTDVYFEEGITKIPGSVFAEVPAVKNIHWVDSIIEIENYAFKQVGIEKLELPDQITIIGDFAFAECESLTELKLSSNLKQMGYHSFYNIKITEVTLPKTLESADRVFVGCTKLTDVYFKEGITKIPGSVFAEVPAVKNIHWVDSIIEIGNYAFSGTSVEIVELPKTVSVIGEHAFYNCKKLSSINLSNEISIGSQAFGECTDLLAFCNGKSNTAIYCIDNNISITPSDEKFVDNENKMLSHKNSIYYANTDAVSASGVIPFIIKFSVKKKWEGYLSNQKIVTYIPKYTNLIEESIKIDGTLISDYSYNEDTRRLTIPVNQNAGSITYSIQVNSKDNITSYAYFSAKKEGTTVIENIDTINESFSGITLSAPDMVNGTEINVSGIAPASTNVDLYVDGIKSGTVTSLKNGAWSGKINLSNPVDCYSYQVTAKSIDEYDAEISVSTNVLYKKTVANLESFQLEYNEHNQIKTCNLIDTNGVKPKIYYMPNSKFIFKAGFDNIENIDKVYITSTRNNEKKSIEAVYDSTSGVYVANGYFNEDNTSYVPGVIGVEYTEKKKDVHVVTEYDYQPFKQLLEESVTSNNINYDKKTTDDVEATIDMSPLFENLSEATVDATIKYVDIKAGTSISDTLELIGITENALSYIVPGVNDEKYVYKIDWTDPENLLMVAYDTSKTVDKIASFKLNMTDVTAAEYEKMFNQAENISNISKGLNFAYSTYGIYKDYDELVNEINQSDTIMDKTSALKKAKELRKDQMAFMVAMTVLPLIAAPEMACATVIYSGLLAVMSSVSGTFFDMRVAQIKGQKFRLNWVVDPSGYVYDKNTDEKIEGATVSAYWIPYDDSEDFWNRKPSETEYGVLWEALEYEQENPLLTNADGKYAWDVPEGWWRVKVEKDGYKTVWSDWMTVPPVQTDVNIAMIPEKDDGVDETKSTVTNLELDIDNMEINVGDTTMLLVNVTPSDISDITLVWSSDNEEVVNVVNGEVTAKEIGVATITVMTQDGAFKDSCQIVVIPKTEQPTTQQPATEDLTTELSTTQTQGESNETVLPKEGMLETISSSIYKVTKSTSSQKEVTFVKSTNSKKTSVTIPSTVTIDGYTYKVTEIAPKAFKSNKKLKSVTIGKNVKKIGKETFYNCTKLKKITIKSSVLKSVGKNAIKNINKKATIKVPKKKLKSYKKLFKSKTGYKKTMKIKK